MDDNTKAGCMVYGGLLVALLVGAFVVNTVAGAVTCEGKTSDMLYPHRYSITGGCQIEVPGEGWIPLDAYYYKPGEGG